MNSEKFLAGQRRYFENAYEEFSLFGGPSVYFHKRCLEAAGDEFLSLRHIEMLYATLASWGMHRMGDPDQTKTKLTEWNQFSIPSWNNAPSWNHYEAIECLKCPSVNTPRLSLL